ncbi:MAG: hypothetical protein K2X54_19155 [Methylobacterium organophilum]|nr:hypothetical protein [Methylobacterium organophilum]
MAQSKTTTTAFDPDAAAIVALLNADTRRGGRSFLKELDGHWAHMPNAFYDEGLDPIDDALEGAAHFAREVKEQWAERRWKAADKSLQHVRGMQWIYRIRLHMETVKAPEGMRLTAAFHEEQPRLEVWDVDEHGNGVDILLILPPFATQEYIDGAIAGRKAGYERGKRAGMRTVSRAVERLMEAA